VPGSPPASPCFAPPQVRPGSCRLRACRESPICRPPGFSAERAYQDLLDAQGVSLSLWTVPVREGGVMRGARGWGNFRRAGAERSPGQQRSALRLADGLRHRGTHRDAGPRLPTVSASAAEGGITTRARGTSWLSQRQCGMGRIPSGAVTGSDRAPGTIKILLQVSLQDISRLPYFEGWLPGASPGSGGPSLSRRAVGRSAQASSREKCAVSYARTRRPAGAGRLAPAGHRAALSGRR
jgi:hypothetical protein